MHKVNSVTKCFAIGLILISGVLTKGVEAYHKAARSYPKEGIFNDNFEDLSIGSFPEGWLCSNGTTGLSSNLILGKNGYPGHSYVTVETGGILDVSAQLLLGHDNSTNLIGTLTNAGDIYIGDDLRVGNQGVGYGGTGQIIVDTEVLSRKTYIRLTASPGPNEPDQLLVLLMGDPQIAMVPQTPANVRTAMDDIVDMKHDFIAVLGDLVQNKAAYYEDYNRLIVQRSIKPVFSIAGNGDIGADPTLGAYKQATGFKKHYRIYKQGVRFIFLSVTSCSGKGKHICHLGPEQLTWLTNELNADTNSTTVIFSHAPVFETTWHSEDRDWEGSPGSMYLYESTEMRNLFNTHSNIKIYAHGHLHHPYGLVDKFGRGNYHMEGNVLHISVGATANNQGSSVLFIRDNEIVVKVRDHQNHAWLDSYEYIYGKHRISVNER